MGIFPGRDALIRRVGAVLADQRNEWTEMRRYIGLEVLAKSRLTIAAENTQPEEVPLTAITAIPRITRCRLHTPRRRT